MLENLEIPAGFGLVIASFCKKGCFWAGFNEKLTVSKHPFYKKTVFKIVEVH